MTAAHDVFAETNPAYCAYVLAAFASGYLTINDRGPELPLCYIVLPIALSGDLAVTFNGTNKNTGLLEWLSRSPQIQVDLTARLNGSMSLVTEAVRFSCFSDILSLTEEGRLQLGNQRPNKVVMKRIGEEAAMSIRHAERLGYWFAMAGSTRTSFGMLGLTV